MGAFDNGDSNIGVRLRKIYNFVMVNLPVSPRKARSQVIRKGDAFWSVVVHDGNEMECSLAPFESVV